MELELPGIDAKNGQIHGNLLTAVASTSLTDTSCCLRGTPWIPFGHRLPHEPLGHQSNGQALGPKKTSVSPSTSGNVRSHHRRTGRMNISENVRRAAGRATRSTPSDAPPVLYGTWNEANESARRSSADRSKTGMPEVVHWSEIVPIARGDGSDRKDTRRVLHRQQALYYQKVPFLWQARRATIDSSSALRLDRSPAAANPHSPERRASLIWTYAALAGACTAPPYLG
jgi:hypothetical protein